MERLKTSLTLHPDVIRRANWLAEYHGMNRSALLSMLVNLAYLDVPIEKRRARNDSAHMRTT